ncbi:MAG: zinc-ribbon domain-containing protein [Candidatus Hermodarchaeota archaeon]
MVKYCANCGSQLEENSQFCVNCGSPISKDVSKKTESTGEDVKSIKNKTKYTLNSNQRSIFLQKVLPTILAGSIIWLISEIIFSIIFIDITFNVIFIAFYSIMVVIEAILFTSLYFAAKNNKIKLGLFIFFLFSLIAGILSLPIIMITELLPQVHMFVSLSVGALLINCFIGVILRENYFAKGNIWLHVVLFLIGTTLVEIVFILIFNIQNFLLTVPVSLAYILIITLTTMFYGSKALQKNEKEPWLLIFFKIEGILLLALIIAIVILVVVLIIIALGVACGGSDFNISGLGGGSSKSRKKKKTNVT